MNMAQSVSLRKTTKYSLFCNFVSNRYPKWEKYRLVFCWLHGCRALIATRTIWGHAPLLNRWPDSTWIRCVDSGFNYWTNNYCILLV